MEMFYHNCFVFFFTLTLKSVYEILWCYKSKLNFCRENFCIAPYIAGEIGVVQRSFSWLGLCVAGLRLQLVVLSLQRIADLGCSSYCSSFLVTTGLGVLPLQSIVVLCCWPRLQLITLGK